MCIVDNNLREYLIGKIKKVSLLNEIFALEEKSSNTNIIPIVSFSLLGSQTEIPIKLDLK